MSDHFCYLRWKGDDIHVGTQGLLPGRQAPPHYLCRRFQHDPLPKGGICSRDISSWLEDALQVLGVCYACKHLASRYTPSI